MRVRTLDEENPVRLEISVRATKSKPVDRSSLLDKSAVQVFAEQYYFIVIYALWQLSEAIIQR